MNARSSHEADDLLGIPQDWDIRVVSRENELTLALFLTHRRNDAFYNETIIEIVFWLIHDQRRIGLQQKKQQYGSGLLARRELIRRAADNPKGRFLTGNSGGGRYPGARNIASVVPAFIYTPTASIGGSPPAEARGEQ